MKAQAKQSRITADFFAGRVTVKQAARIARKAKRASMHKAKRASHNRGES